jgi:glycosyltransferase involved in cell wall biosynthesis
MAASGSEGTVDGGATGGWVLCELAGAGRPGATIAHVVNRMAVQSPGCDIALAFGALTPAPGWQQKLRDAARRESTTATVSALSVDAGSDAEETEALEDALGGSGVAPVPGMGSHDRGPLAPRVSLVSGPVLYVVRAALDLLGGMDESLSTSAGAVAEFGLRAREHGLANLVSAELLSARDPSLRLGEDDRDELACRFPVLWGATEQVQTAAVERAFALAKAATERKLAVTVDARALGAATGGTQTYTLELLRALDATGEVKVRALFAGETPVELGGLANTEAITYRAALQGAPVTDLVHRPQQVFSVDDLTLLQPLGDRLLITQLDLIAYHTPTYFADVDTWRRHVRATRIAMDAADHVLFLSEHARADAEREDLIDRERTAIVPLGVNPVVEAPAQESSTPAVLKGRHEPFLLCLGSDYAHKNRPYALELTAALRRGGWPGILVLAGTHVAHGSSAAAERAVCERNADLADAVLDAGSVSASDRRWLMSHAGAVVYPTVLEGFGLIPLEAAAAGVPCLFAAQSSLAETLPPSLATLDGWNVERSALASMHLLVDPQERARHVAAMHEVLREYTWERCARETIDAYHATLASRARLSAQAAWEAHARELEIVRLDRAVSDKTEAMERLLDSIGEDGLALVGPYGLLSRDDRRALLAIASRGPLRRGLFAGLRGGYRVMHRERE